MPVFSSRVPSKIRPRVDFNMEEFRKLLFSKGLPVTWEQCAECPCSQLAAEGFPLTIDQALTQKTGEARADCPTCNGRGYLWHAAQPITALVTSQSANADAFALYGEYGRGMVSITTLPEHLPAYGDRFTVLDSVMVRRETRTRTQAGADTLRYPIIQRTLDLAGGVELHGVLYLHASDASGIAPINGQLSAGVDFTITPQGAIDWTLGDGTGTAPAAGTLYSVSYYANPRYYVADHPHAHRDSRTQRKQATVTPLLLPVQSHCSLEFMGGPRE